MRIISTLLPPLEDDVRVGERPAVVLALDTLIDDKSVVLGITIGQVNGQTLQDVVLSDVGRTIVRRGLRHAQFNHPDAAVVVAGVAQLTGAKQRVRQVLAKAPEHAFVLLVAATDDVCAAVIKAVGLHHQAAHVKPH